MFETLVWWQTQRIVSLSLCSLLFELLLLKLGVLGLHVGPRRRLIAQRANHERRVGHREANLPKREGWASRHQHDTAGGDFIESDAYVNNEKYHEENKANGSETRHTNND